MHKLPEVTAMFALAAAIEFSQTLFYWQKKRKSGGRTFEKRLNNHEFSIFLKKPELRFTLVGFNL